MRIKFDVIRIRSETYCELKALFTKQRGRKNSIRAIRTIHSLTMELRETLRTESDSLCELTTQRSAICDLQH